MQAPWWWSKTEISRSDIYVYFNLNFNVFFKNKNAFVFRELYMWNICFMECVCCWRGFRLISTNNVIFTLTWHNDGSNKLVDNEQKMFSLELSWTDCWNFGGRFPFASCLSGSCTRSGGRWWRWRCRRRGRCSVTALQTRFWCTGKWDPVINTFFLCRLLRSE